MTFRFLHISEQSIKAGIDSITSFIIDTKFSANSFDFVAVNRMNFYSYTVRQLKPYFKYSFAVIRISSLGITYCVLPALEARWSYILIAEGGLRFAKVGNWKYDSCKPETRIEKLHCSDDEFMQTLLRQNVNDDKLPDTLASSSLYTQSSRLRILII